jgi:phenylacetate-coenzyme A ligase PaaK-like adenylate-forming protein
MVGASSATHMSAALSQTFSSPANPRHLFPVSQPLADIVAGLNDLQPTILMGYSSYLPRLALESRAGRLRIAPCRVIGVSEPLLPEVRASVEAAWGVPVDSAHGMSEGLFTGFCGQSTHLPDDLCFLEPVAADGNSVRPGHRSDRVLVTNLYNPVLPLIRFDVTDEVIVAPDTCPWGSAFRCIDDPQGRLDDAFAYPGDVIVHPHVFRSAIAAHRQVVEYQVQQTALGADVRVVAEGELDAATLRSRLERALVEAGLHHPSPHPSTPENRGKLKPQVTVSVVARLERQPTGKLKRFVTLPD